jgi:hypothetical protein
VSDVALIPEHTVSRSGGRDTRPRTCPCKTPCCRRCRAADRASGLRKVGYGFGNRNRAGCNPLSRQSHLTLINEYDSSPRFHHADLYRLSELEVIDLGLEEYATPDEIMAIEWPERAEEYIRRIAGEQVWRVDFSYTGNTSREIRITPPAAAWRTDMNILSIDTATDQASVALFIEGAIYSEWSWRSRGNHRNTCIR